MRAFGLQEKIYPFLIKCCEIILYDFLELGSLLDEKYPIIPEKEVSTGSSAIVEIQASLAYISGEAPYRLPVNLDLERLRGILAARLSAAKDHLFALREDPGYFADTIDDWSQHRNDRLLDTRGNLHPTGLQTLDFWERVIRNVIADGYSGYETWTMLFRQVNKLCTLKNKYENEISYEKQLPKEYLIAILKFKQM